MELDVLLLYVTVTIVMHQTLLLRSVFQPQVSSSSSFAADFGGSKA